MTNNAKLFVCSGIVSIVIFIVIILHGVVSSALSQSFANLYAKNISLTPKACFMEIDTYGSGIYFFGYDYIVEGRTLQITVYTETLSPWQGNRWPVKISIIDDALAEVDSICFKNGQAVKCIYPY